MSGRRICFLHYLITIVLLMPVISGFGQDYSLYKSRFDEHLTQIKVPETPPGRHFKEAYDAFFAGEYDSVLVHTHQFLISKNQESELRDLCRFFRGTAFLEKSAFHQALHEYDRISGTFVFQPLVDIQRGSAFLYLEQYDKAIKILTSLETRSEGDRALIDKGVLNHNIGICYLHLEMYAEAEPYLLLSLGMHQTAGDTLRMISSYMDLGNLYYIQFRDEQAIPYFSKAYELARKSGTYESRMQAALNMAVVEENRDNPLAALEFRKEFDQWKDSLHDEQRLWETARMERSQQIEHDRQKIELLRRDNEIRRAERNGFIYSSLLLALLLVAAVAVYRRSIRVNRLIRQQKAELDQLNTFKDRMFSVVSHDLRSMVRGLGENNRQLLEEFRGQKLEDLEARLETNKDLSESTLGLLDNTLNWAKLQTGQYYFHRERVKLRPLVDQVAFNYRVLLEQKRISFENSVDPGLRLFMDGESFKIVLRNLLDNAIKFTGENGNIVLLSDEEDGNAVIRVTDTGRGIEPERLKQLFGSDKGSKPSGIGLILCREMLEEQGGSLGVESIPGKGTTVIIRLPMSSD